MKPKEFEYKGRKYRAYIDSSRANSLLWIHVDRRTKNKYFFKWKQYNTRTAILSSKKLHKKSTLNIPKFVLDKQDHLRYNDYAVKRKSPQGTP